MAAPEQRRERTIPIRGIVGDLYQIQDATKDVQGRLRQARYDMLNETGNPRASQILEEAIHHSIRGSRLREETLLIKTLKMARIPDDKIREILKAKRHLGKTYGYTDPSEDSEG